MAKKGLGKGLGALLAEHPEVEDVMTKDSGTYDKDKVINLKIIDVEPNKNQPRQSFDDEKLDELAESIKQHGVISPILVSSSKNGFYKIIAGERRWRASKKAGLKTIPAIVKDLDDLHIQQIALIENLQRQDLNPVEEALGYKRLMDEFSLTQEQISNVVGKNRSTVANSLRLINLPDDVLELLKDGRLSVGHAKVILSCEGEKRRSELAKAIVDGDLSVRASEKLVKEKSSKNTASNKIDLNLKLAFEAVEKSMSSALGTKVKIKDKGNKGTIQIEYYSSEELQRIIEILNKS